MEIIGDYHALMIFVNWFAKKHHEMDIHYRLEFKYNEIIDVVAHTAEGVLVASEVHEGPFAINVDKANLPSHMPWSQQIGDLHFDEVIYTEHGAWWKMHYVGDTPRPTYLVGEHGSNTNFCPYPSAHGNYKVDHYESCFLPYPRLKNSDYAKEYCRIVVGNGHERRILTPPAQFEVQKGAWEIVGTSLSGANHAAIHTRAINPLPFSTQPTAASSAPESKSSQSSSPASEPAQSSFFAVFVELIAKIKAFFN